MNALRANEPPTKLRCATPACRGFSLVEVMVALVVISVGLLGIAKMQALALSDTGMARVRSLAALEAASLASTMRADRAYWSAITNTSATPFTVTVKTGTVTAATDSTLTTTATCNSSGSPCSTASIAAYDLQQWASDFQNAQMPNSTSTVSCAIPAGTTNPVSCSIVITWSENQVGADSKSTGQASVATSYTLYVEP